jgi:hypothetical protein
MSRTVYATMKDGTRIGAVLDPERGQILVHIVNGGMVGWYNFPHEKLTPATLLATVQK